MKKKYETFMVEYNCFKNRVVGKGSIIEIDGQKCKVTDIKSVRIGQSRVKIFGNYVPVIEEVEED